MFGNLFETPEYFNGLLLLIERNCG